MDKQAQTYYSSAELSFRRGVHLSQIIRICTSSEQSRKALINAGTQQGLTEVNGVPIADFVVVETNLGKAYNKYVKPFGV